MQRVFTKDVGAHFKAGEIRDYPHDVWVGIAQSAHKGLDEISVTVEGQAKAAAERDGKRK